MTTSLCARAMMAMMSSTAFLVQVSQYINANTKIKNRTEIKTKSKIKTEITTEIKTPSSRPSPTLTRSQPSPPPPS